MAGYFKLKHKIPLSEINDSIQIPESDFATVTPNGDFVQFEYFEDNKQYSTIVKPGIYSIQEDPYLRLEKTELIKNKLLDTFDITETVSNKINCFFNRIQIYYDEGFEVPKRTILLYGPPGCGKSSIISNVCSKYVECEDTAVVFWKTDRIKPGSVKDFIKGFIYEGVKKLVLIIEDIGGVEVENHEIPSSSSLLALLDNQEKSFTIPTLILATTNYPENFLGNLMDRPQRIDDKIKVDYPQAESRAKLFEFYSRKTLDKEALELIKTPACDTFSPAHIKEVFLRSAIYDIPLSESIKQIQEDIKLYKNHFSNKKKIGFFDD